MSSPLSRRAFVAGSLVTGATLSELSLLTSLPSLSARDVKSNPNLVQFSPDIEPLVRLIEEKGPFVIHAAPEIAGPLDELLRGFVAERRMKLVGEYRPSYRIA